MASEIGIEVAAGEDPQPKADLAAWWMVAVLWLLYSLSFMDRYILSMLVDPIKADLGLSDFQMSLILGPAFAVCYAIATLPAGWAADRYPRRWVAFVGTTLWSIASFAAGFAQNFPALLVARVGVGVGEAGLSPAAYAMIADRFPRNRVTTASAVFQTGIKAGSAAAFGVGGLLLAFATGIGHQYIGGFHVAPWQLVMIMVGLPGIFIALLVFTFSEPPRGGSAASTTPKPPLWPFIKAHKRLFIPIAIGFSLTSICSAALIAWVPAYIGRRFGLPPIHYGAILSGLSLLGAVALVLKSSVVDWLFGRGMKDAHIRFYCWVLLISLPIAVAIFFVSNATAFFVMYGFLQVAMISYSVYATASLSLITPPNLRGRVTALFLLTVNLAGSGLGALIVGALTDYVFQDKDMVGMSLAATISVAMPGALIALWWSLSEWRRILGAQDAAPAAAAS